MPRQAWRFTVLKFSGARFAAPENGVEVAPKGPLPHSMTIRGAALAAPPAIDAITCRAIAR